MLMPVHRLSIVAVLLLFASTAKSAEPLHPSVSFLVSAKNPIRDVSTGDLRRIFLGEISRWTNGHRIVLLVRPSDSPEGRLFLERLVRMSDIDYSQWWLGAVFRGRAAAAPRIVGSTDAMAKAVAANPDAIGLFLTTPAALESDLAVLTIDGKLPADPEYPVRVR
jgi:ABC-type phosphate transport system substrate-binding protein